MSTLPATANAIVNQLGPGFSVRAMFGEYALYCGDRVVALVCDDQVFVKDVPASARLRETCEQAPPYPGAKPHHLVAEEDVRELEGLLREVATQVPAPKKKAPKKKK